MRSLPFILVSLAVISLLASPSTEAAKRSSTVRGEVLELQERVQTRNGGEWDHLRIRTESGDERRLRLCKAGSCSDCVREGDRIRARVRDGAPGEPARVESMKVRRSNYMLNYRFQGSGEPIRQHTRAQARDGSEKGKGDAYRWRGSTPRRSSHSSQVGRVRGGGPGLGRGSRGGGGG